MMAVLLTFITIAAPAAAWGAGQNVEAADLEYNPRIENMISQINESEIYHTTYKLQNFSSRKYPSVGNILASQYLYGRLVNISGLQVEYQGTGFQNIIATIPGREVASNMTFIVGAHYDSISDTGAYAPGATDNGCGTAIVLELARVMNQYDFNHTIKFAFWNAEEVSPKGSQDYVNYARKNSMNIPLYFNYDSSCYDPQNQYVLDIMFDNKTEKISELIIRYNYLYKVNFQLTSNVHSCTSDHLSFRQGGYPAIMTHSQSHGPAHTQYDTIDKISVSYAKKNAQLGMSVLANEAGLKGVLVLPLPGFTNPPTDPDGDGIYEDINGNNRLDFADVILFFNRMTWIGANEPVGAFDLNGNGRIDFADIVALFNEI